MDIFWGHYSVYHKDIRDKGTREDSFTAVFTSEEAIRGTKALTSCYTISSEVTGSLIHCIFILPKSRSSQNG